MCNDAKTRFLTAYSEVRTVAEAARRAGISRMTIYRWRADPDFKTAMQLAWQRGYQRWYREVYEPEAAARKQARERRNAELRPMRQSAARHMGTFRRR